MRIRRACLMLDRAWEIDYQRERATGNTVDCRLHPKNDTLFGQWNCTGGFRRECGRGPEIDGLGHISGKASLNDVTVVWLDGREVNTGGTSVHCRNILRGTRNIQAASLNGSSPPHIPKIHCPLPLDRPLPPPSII